LPFSEKSETSFDNHLIPVIQKAVRAIVWSLGIVIGLDNIGFDITAMIAGLRNRRFGFSFSSSRFR
jgi:MscS family membrane protein